MRIAILANESLRQELLQKKALYSADIFWPGNLHEMIASKPDASIDLLFEPSAERIEMLRQMLPAPVIIHSVSFTTAATHPSFIRVNGWPGFIGGNKIEIAAGNEQQEAVQQTMNALGWGYRIVPDQVGMIAPRIVAMIINEAYLALGEQVSTKEEIDTAMKLGTNYPFGPFEWSEKIGLRNVKELLDSLSNTDERYIPAPALVQEVSSF
ncbi:MAG: hypothetical protein H7Y03_12685 [Chitinophagaceae bacterium]|nr:hypothetical protein [Chitinophagaceae bacterium]